MPRPDPPRGPRRALLPGLLAALILAPLSALPGLPGAAPPPLAPEPGWVADARQARAARLAGLGVTRWHAAGWRGRGVKVAVLDTGFRGYRARLGSVEARSFRRDANLEARASAHGVLCAEVVRALAPEAGLVLADWEPGRPGSFLRAVRWARGRGARVLCCSVIMPAWGDGEGGGPVHEGLARALGGALLFASAGNTARRHWYGAYRPGSDGFHQWRPGQPDNALLPWGDERVSVEVYGTGAAEYEVLVYGPGEGEPVARGAGPGPGECGVSVRFRPEGGKEYRVRVRLRKGEGGSFHCVALRAGLAYATARGSVCFPADGPGVVAVAAADAAGRRMGYSSCGPNSARPKPDLAAVVPFPSLWRERPFGGTSAAAPQAGALAALWWSRHPDWGADRVRRALVDHAARAGGGHSPETGYGLIGLP